MPDSSRGIGNVSNAETKGAFGAETRRLPRQPATLEGCTVDGDAGLRREAKRGAINGSQSVEKSSLFPVSPLPPWLGAAGALRQGVASAPAPQLWQSLVRSTTIAFMSSWTLIALL